MQLFTTTTPAMPLIRAAEYLRMSTDAQHYSIPHQQTTIREYAGLHGMTVIRTYADEGKSGLTLRGRESLVQLLADVQSGLADFEVILVYDVSRWGRFQDVDESGYYEFLCRKAHVRIEYCAEPFANQTGPLVTILKSIKRAMAAEYSRELGTKIAFAKRRGTMKGYHQGGRAGFALRRMLVAPDGRQIQLLERGARKGIKDYRTLLVPGPPNEVETVQRIFGLYVDQRLDSPTIAGLLNQEGIERVPGQGWTKTQILAVLHNERYVGHLVVNRSSSNLAAGRGGSGHVKHDPSLWVRSPIGFDGFVSADLFERAKKLRSHRGKRYRSERAMLESLRDLLARHGWVNTDLINATKDMPTSPAFLRHFGSLRRAYEQIGYVQARDWSGQPESLHRLAIVKQVFERIVDAVRGASGSTTWHGTKRQLTLNGKRTVGVALGRCSSPLGELQWHVVSGRGHLPDAMIIARLNAANLQPMDYLCLPPGVVRGYLNRVIRDTPSLGPYLCATIDEVIGRVVSDDPIAR